LDTAASFPTASVVPPSPPNPPLPPPPPSHLPSAAAAAAASLASEFAMAEVDYDECLAVATAAALAAGAEIKRAWDAARVIEYKVGLYTRSHVRSYGAVCVRHTRSLPVDVSRRCSS